MDKTELNEAYLQKFGYRYDDMEKINVDVAEPTFGAQIGIQGLRVHPKTACKFPDRCCIHNPSDHHMKDWPLNWRGDRGMMERIDPNTGIGHPDPDDVYFHTQMHPEDSKYYSVHGCDGACQPPS